VSDVQKRLASPAAVFATESGHGWPGDPRQPGPSEDTDPDALPPVTRVLPLPPPGLPTMLPLVGVDEAEPALPPVFEPAAPASEPW
jgi:hypothetical protein